MLWNATLGKMLMTFLIAMVPVVELRGAIPIGTASGLPLQTSIILSMLGNLLPVPFIILFISRIFTWLRGKSERWDALVTRIETRAEKKSESVRRYVFWGLALFVAVPLPGTGAWTGALIASMLQMPMKRALPSIALGVAGAGIIVSLVTYGAGAVLMNTGVMG